MVPERQVVDDAGSEQPLEAAQEDAANNLAGQIVGDALEETHDGPTADAKSDPLPSVSQAVAAVRLC